jgi:P27 family predicted phage terminase small subunit
MRGRKPKPTALAKLHGNPRQRGKAERADEPAPRIEPDVGAVPAPAHLSDAAAKEWRRLMLELGRLNLVTVVDNGMLEAYCACYGRFIEAEAKVREMGMVVKTAKGNVIQNPYLSIVNRCIREMHRLGAEFGMSPASRPRLGRAPSGRQFELPLDETDSAALPARDDLDAFLGARPTTRH